MEKDKRDGKEKYRKQKYTRRYTRDLDSEIKEFERKLKKIPNNSLIETYKLLIKTFKKNPDFRFILFAPEAYRKYLIELGKKGANIEIIYDALKTPDIPEYLKGVHPFGLQLYEGELSPEWNQQVEEYNEKKVKMKNKEKALRGAIGQLTSLEPVSNPEKRYRKDEVIFVNAKLVEVQNALKEFEKVLEIYLVRKEGIIGYPLKWGVSIDKLMDKKFKRVTSSTHGILNKRIIMLVDEMKRIGYSDKQSYVKTAELLFLAFPHIYKEKDPDFVRQKYTYHKK